MSFRWTPHRFVGGALALDVANSVILRHDPKKRIDRFADPINFVNFPSAASALSYEAPTLGPFSPIESKNQNRFIALRESVDRFFRACIEDDHALELQAVLLERIAEIFRAHAASPLSTAIDLATARSALRLMAMEEPARLKICGNCGWLFMDRSKNKSRTWCDMTVCGNRAKAKLHYAKKRKAADP